MTRFLQHRKKTCKIRKMNTLMSVQILIYIMYSELDCTINGGRTLQILFLVLVGHDQILKASLAHRGNALPGRKGQLLFNKVKTQSLINYIIRGTS